MWLYMCKMWCRWFWKGQQAKYKLLFHIFPFTLLEKFLSCIESICSMTCTYFEAVFIEMSSKMTVATKLWTFWSQVQYRFKRSTLALIVRNISRDAENQRYWSDLRFIERFLTKIVWHWGCRHCKALAGNAPRDIWLFNQILIMMYKDTMKKLIWFLPVVTRNFELSTRTPKFLSVRLFWIARGSAWRLWESNQRHVLRQLQVLFCPRERPVWTIHDLRIFWANWCKKGQNSLSRYIVDALHTELLRESVGIEPVTRASILHLLYALTTTTSRQCTTLRNYVPCSQTRQTHCGILNFFIKFLAQGVIENRHAPRR